MNLKPKAMKTKEKPNRNELEFVKSVGSKMNEVRLWKDKEGRIWLDPHPKIDLVAGDTLIPDCSKS